VARSARWRDFGIRPPSDTRRGFLAFGLQPLTAIFLEQERRGLDGEMERNGRWSEIYFQQGRFSGGTLADASLAPVAVCTGLHIPGSGL
jgi:hypothetical protein